MKYLLTLSVLFLLLTTSCDDDTCVEGGGTLQDYPLTVGTFDKISVSGPINIEITQGSTQQVVVQTEPEIFGIMETKVLNGEFILDFKDGSCIKPKREITLLVTVADLTKISASGTSDIYSTGDLVLNNLTIEVSGLVKVSLTGSATEQTFNVSGSISVENFDFVTENTTIDISGSGELEVNCTQNLDITVSGAATIKYKGNPTINQNASGSLSLINSN